MLGAAWFASGALLGAVAVGSAPAAWADFQQSSSSTAQLAADVLEPPSGLGATLTKCGASGVLDLRWTASPTSWLERYDVLLSADGGPYGVVSPPADHPPTATSRSIGGLDTRTAYRVIVRSARGSWWAATADVGAVPTKRKC